MRGVGDELNNNEGTGGEKSSAIPDSGAPLIKAYLRSLRKEVDEELDRRARFSSDCPKRLADAMRYSLLAPGKRLRPILAIVAAELCGGVRADVLPACVALESVHSYSLIHDDLPSMDDDDLRRGRPSCHRKFDEATAILAGDALQTFAFEVLASDVRPSEVAASCVRELALAAGAVGMVGGQLDDVLWASTLKCGAGAYDLIGEALTTAADARRVDESDSGTGDPRLFGFSAFLRKIHRRKTGMLTAASVKLGALTARASSRQLEILEKFGFAFGQAFQIADDVLDVVGNEESMGKRVHKDEASGKLTYPALLGLDGAISALESAVENAKGAFLGTDDVFDLNSLPFAALNYLVDYAARREK